MRRGLANRSLVVGSLVAIALFSSGVARAGDPAAAREQVKLGYQLAQEGKCEEAIPHFVESLRLDAKAVTLINLANCEEKTAKLADALGHWVEARARAQFENNGPIEEEAEKRAKALDGRIPKLTLSLPPGAPKDAVVTRDGVVLGAASMGVPLPVNPGAHSLMVRAPGREDAETNVTLGEAEMKQVSLRLGAIVPVRSEAKAPAVARSGDPAKASPLVAIGFTTAAVGAVVGTITGVMAFGKASSADDGCPTPSTCTKQGLDDVDSGRTLGTVSTIGFAVGAVGLALGVSGLVWGAPKSSSVGVAVGPVRVGPSASGLGGTF